VVGVVIAAVAVVALGVQAVRGNRTVAVQRSAHTEYNAHLDDAFYNCIDVQTHSLVAPGQSVTIDAASLSDFVTLLKGAGSWISFADPPTHAAVKLSLQNHVHGPGACLGTVVVARYAQPHAGPAVRRGSGASVAGMGPVPATPL
jgi:hypothetical protein